MGINRKTVKIFDREIIYTKAVLLKGDKTMLMKLKELKNYWVGEIRESHGKIKGTKLRNDFDFRNIKNGSVK